LRYYVGGERKHATIGTLGEFPSESTARKSPKVQALLAAANADSPLVGGAITVGVLIARYEKDEMPGRYSTSSSYRSYLDCHIKPKWADTLVSDVKSMAVEQWLNKLELAPKTKSHIKQLLHVVFACAMRWELVERNPLSLVRVKGGSKRSERPRILEVAEFGRLIVKLSDPYRTMVMIAGALGLRVSEIMGLQWGDFDFENRTVLVQRGVVHGRVGEVKTEYSKDHLPMDSVLARKLRQYRRKCHPTKEGWLFANPATDRPYHQEEIVKTHLKVAAKTAKIAGKIGWHTFRHSYRAWLQQSAAPLAVQQELMRHASITTTMNTYGAGAMTDSKRLAHSKVVEMVFPNLRKAGAA